MLYTSYLGFNIVVTRDLLESAKLEKVLFTPSTKAELGTRDENITEEEVAKLVGNELYAKVRDISVNIFCQARAYAETRAS